MKKLIMPLPWKKSKIDRVSRFVSDLKSSKSSLVVETGFPTSLLDLMIKNRDRLKKPSKKNKKLSVDPSSSVPPSSSSSLNSTMLMVPASPSSIKTLIRNHVGPSYSCNDDEKIDENEIISTTTQPRKQFFLFMLLILLLLSLGFGTKKTALLFTITAFVLRLVEIGGKIFISFLKPCPDAKDNFDSVVESVLSVQPKFNDETDLLNKNDSSLIEQNENLGLIEVENGDQICIENENSTKNESGGLIIDENGGGTKEEIQIEPGFDSLRCGCRWGFSASDQKKKLVTKNDVEIIEDSNAKGLKKKTSVKFNPKMLKKCFVPILRGSKKKKKKTSKEENYLDSRSEFTSTTAVDERFKNRLDDQENEDELEDDEQEEDEEDDVASGDFSQIELETELKPSDVTKRITTSWNSILIPSVIIVILIGLITGGRLIALGATVIIWCLLPTLKTQIAKKKQ